MKTILVSDIHLGHQKNDDIWLNQAKRLFDNIIDTCHKMDIDCICILGDFFNDRKSIGVKTINTALDIADKLYENNIEVYMIVGNHDAFYKNSLEINGLKIFKRYENIHIIEDNEIIENIGMVSWEQTPPKYTDFLFGHFEINGFNTSKNTVYENAKQNIIDFADYKYVYSGHFHIPSTKNNITYLGTPYALTFNDANYTHGYFIFDNGKLDFIEFDDIKYRYISSEDIFTINPNSIKGNIIKLIYEKDYGLVENNRILEQVQAMEPLRIHTDFTKISKVLDIQDTLDENTDLKDNKEILFEYIGLSQLPENITTKQLKDAINILLED